MKRLLGLLCVLGLFFSLNLKAMEEQPADVIIHEATVVAPSDDVVGASISTPVPPAVAAKIEQQIVKTAWYKSLGQKIKSCGSCIPNGYHKICNGLSLIKGKTVNGAKFLFNTKTGNTVLVMALVAGYAIEVEVFGYDPMHSQEAVAYVKEAIEYTFSHLPEMPKFGSFGLLTQ